MLLAYAASAQRNYVPGALLLLNGDSLSGQIDYRKWDINPLTVSFREGDNAAAKEYVPADIKGFRIRENQETYLSLPAVMDVTNEKLDVLSFRPDRDTITGNHFMRVLMTGPVQLLLYADRNHRQHFFIIEKDSVTQLVKKMVFIGDRNSPDYGKLKTHHFYRQQLVVALGDCVPARQLAGLDYSETALRRVLQQYVACRYPGQQVELPKKDKDLRVSLGVMGGAGLNMYRFSGVHPMALGQYGPQAAPVVGVFLDVPISRNRQKLAWTNELIYTSRAVRGNWSKNGFLNEVDVQEHYVQVQTLVKYTFPTGAWRPYFNAGMTGAIYIGGKDELRKTRENDGSLVEATTALDGGREFFLPLLIGAGVRYNRLHTELRVILPNNMSPYEALSATAITPQLLVRYTLF